MAGQYAVKIVSCVFAVWLAAGVLWGIYGCSDEGETCKSNLSTDKSSQSVETKSPSDQFPKIVKVGLESYEPADNSECMVCHADFAEEELSVKHEEAGVGCAECHGPSEDHGGDEANVLFPDYLYGRSEIVNFCKTCHKEEHPMGKMYELFLKKWSGKYRPNGRMISDESICTDCHGNHAILSPHQMQLSAE
ncbi:MAG: cytochrome c3 family protein [Planctomycetota bacterium]